MERFWEEDLPGYEFFDNLAGPAAVFSVTGEKIRILKVNRRYMQEAGVLLTRQLLEEVDPLSWHEEQSRKEYLEAINRAVGTGGEVVCETWRMIPSDCCGEDRVCIRSSIQCVEQTVDSDIIYARVQNVTDERNRYYAVAQSEDRFRHAAEQVNVYAWEYDVATRQMRSCYRCMRDLGLPALINNYPEPVIEAGIFPADYADMYRDWHRQIEQGVKHLESIIPLTVGRVPFHVRYDTEFDENGKPVKAYGSAALVVENEDKKAEYQEIIETLSRDYQNLFRINLADDVSTVIQVRDYAYDKLTDEDLAKEYSFHDECRRYIKSMVYPADVPMMTEALKPETIRRHLDMGRDYVVNFRSGRDGDKHYQQFRIFRLEKHDSIIMAFQNVDAMVAEQRGGEKLLKQALQEATDANAAKTAYLSHISHDIRTPLNGIIGLLKIDEKHPDDVEMLKENRAKIKVAADHLLSLINNVLQLSKIEDNSLVLAHEKFDLTKLEGEVLTIADMRALDSGITLHSLHGEQPIYVMGSPVHVKQVLLNILGNAVKYNRPEGSVTFEAWTEEETDQRICRCIRISDTGQGMSQEFIEHIFEPFSQEKHDEKSELQGTGLGMSIVKALVDKMGGTIEIESTPGEGSTFTVRLYFERVGDQQAEAREMELQQADVHGIRALFVEDNRLNVLIGTHLLEEAGMQNTTVYNGVEAVETFRNSAPHTYDVILMDVMMPVMDGLSATRIIRDMDREDAADIPIIAMTANAFEEDRQRALEAGMSAFVTKPLDIEELIREIARLVHKEEHVE